MYYIHIPSHVYLNKDFTKHTQNLYGLLIALAYKDGYCYATNNRLAEILEVSNSTISKSLQQLKQADLISVEINALNNFRKIMTKDTVNGLKVAKKENKAPIKASKTSTKAKIERFVPEWMAEFEDLLDQQ